MNDTATWTCEQCGGEHETDQYGYTTGCESGLYGNCHECGKAALLVPSGAAAKDPGSVCRECYRKLENDRRKSGSSAPRARRLSKRKVQETKDDLLDLLKELET